MLNLRLPGKGINGTRGSRSPIAIISNIKDVEAGEVDIKVDDYLNDKFQTLADYASIDNLLEQVEIQRIQLDQQLQKARDELEECKKEEQEHVHHISAQTQSFQSQQASIDRRLAIITSSDSPDEAVRLLEGPMEKLRKLDIASAYVEILREIDELATEARKNLPQDPKGALKPYSHLKQLSISLQTLQEPADHAGVHLVTYVYQRVELLWLEMKVIMSNSFETVLRDSNWPKEAQIPNKDWTECFDKLLDLQAPEFGADKSSILLLPFEVMVKPFQDRFRYHFMGSRPTNSKQHPEQAFAWVIETFSESQEYLLDEISPVLSNHFRGTEFVNSSSYANALSAFITAFLPVMREKITDLLRTISPDPQLLSHFMLEIIKFDNAVREEFNYDGGDPRFGWKGLTCEVLETKFDRWLEVEKKFALARYEEIIASPDAGLLDYDSTGPGRTKSTFGSLKVTDLLNTVTVLFKDVHSFSHQLGFCLKIQLPILDMYHSRLFDSLNAYQSMTSTVGRTLHGISKEEQTKLEGIGGLESLCKVFGSAQLVINVLNDWGNDITFITMWNELQRRSRNTDIEDKIAGSMTHGDIKTSTSAAVGTGGDGALFDETSNAFKARRDHAERLIVEALKYALPGALRPYFQKPQWLTVDIDPEAVSNPYSLHVTAELDQPLRTLRGNMAFLNKTLATPVFRHIWREVLDTLQDLLWDEVLMKERFTTLGAAQFFRDITAINSVVDNFIPNGSSSSFGLTRLQEGIRLLNLPPIKGDSPMSLAEAYVKATKDNEAREIISELDLKHITIRDLRNILGRRVEASE